VLALPLAAGWLVATFVALTMHGFWWPGRQVVVVLPLALLVVLCWLARAGTGWRVAAALLGTAGAVSYGWLLADGYTGTITWVSRFAEVGAPTHQLLRPLLPDYRDEFWPAHLAWIAALGLLAALAWHHTRSRNAPGGAMPTPVPVPAPHQEGSTR
ncbi:MAG: hypothetical protein ACRDRZ_09800, partial [Pseudonocardiaceae bacterium]